MCFFGNFDRDHFASNFNDTFNSFEKKASILKDVPNVLDDCNPEVGSNFKNFMLEKTLGAYGDRGGRGRLNSNTSFRVTYKPAGLCVVTGESSINLGESRAARAICINMNRNDVDIKAVRELEKESEKLAFTMMKYIEWIIDNTDEIIEFVKKKLEELTTNILEGVHGRTLENINILKVGLRLFLKFLWEHDIITIAKQDELIFEADDIFDSLMLNQKQEMTYLDPIEMFYSALEEMIDSRNIFVPEVKNGKVVTDIVGTVTGYTDIEKNRYYFFPGLIYQKVVEFYRKKDTKFPLNDRTLWKTLIDARVDEKRCFK